MACKVSGAEAARKSVLSGKVGTEKCILLQTKEMNAVKKITAEKSPSTRKTVAPRVGSLVQIIAGCKWSLTVFELLRRDINRPGAMVRSVEGLSTKALNECMRRLLEFDLVDKSIFPEVPPRVEYAVTAKGARLLEIFDAMDRLEADLEPIE